MESITLLLLQPIILAYNLLIDFKIFFVTNFEDSIPVLVSILYFVRKCLVIYLRGYNIVFTLRFILAWFPNVNPYIAPYYIIRVLTQPYIDWIDKRLPRLFGLDLSFLVCSVILGLAIKYLSV